MPLNKNLQDFLDIEIVEEDKPSEGKKLSVHTAPDGSELRYMQSMGFTEFFLNLGKHWTEPGDLAFVNLLCSEGYADE